MGKGLILGIDLSKDYTQLAYVDEEGNAKSVSVGTEDNYMIPTVVCHNKELDEWSAGYEALNKSKLSSSTVYDKLATLIEKEDEEAVWIMKIFMSYLLKTAMNFCGEKLVKNVLVTVDDVNPNVIEVLMESLTGLGILEENIKILSHSESFVYYVLNQSKDIWINQVYFINFNKDSCICRKLKVIKGREPYVAGVTTEDLSSIADMETLEKNPAHVDKVLADYMREKLGKHVISGIYLSGEAFYKEEFKETISVLCGNRRVFKGNNLIVKGAALAAREFFHIPVLEHYIISCKGRTKVKVTMAVKHKGSDNTITLSNVGDYWYQARSKAECIMEERTEAVFEIHDVMNHKNEIFTIDLTQFPKRPAKTTRIEVNFRYIEENIFEISIKDLGFGEFFESSGMVVKKEIKLSE